MCNKRLWIARVLIFVVFFVNVQCGVLFIALPDQFVRGFELEGAVGEGAVRGFGILFLMWNIPFAVALSHPVMRRISLYESIAMQATGLVGESLLLAGLPAGHMLLRETVTRFIVFDGAGLLFLVAALLITANRATAAGFHVGKN
jgi:hypothetical protein